MQKIYKQRRSKKFDYKQFKVSTIVYFEVLNSSDLPGNLFDFQPMRDCSFAHHHEQFKNSIKLMSFRQIRKKVYKEAYFDMYFSHIVENKYT